MGGLSQRAGHPRLRHHPAPIPAAPGGSNPALDHVFVDEFQDTNPIQFAIHLAWLARPATRLTVVGDDDQALYRFRGSDIAVFTGLEDACREAGIAFRREKLEQNWRSSNRIVAFAGAFRRETVLTQVSMAKTVRAPDGAPVGEPPDCSRASGLACVIRWPPNSPRLAPGACRTGRKSRRRWPSCCSPRPRRSVAAARRASTCAGRWRPRTAGLQPAQQDGRSPRKPRTQPCRAAVLPDRPGSIAPAGSGGRPVMVWASCGDAAKSPSPVEPRASP